MIVLSGQRFFTSTLSLETKLAMIFEAEPYAPLHVKGKSEAVDVYEVVGLKGSS